MIEFNVIQNEKRFDIKIKVRHDCITKWGTNFKSIVQDKVVRLFEKYEHSYDVHFSVSLFGFYEKGINEFYVSFTAEELNLELINKIYDDVFDIIEEYNKFFTMVSAIMNDKN